MGVGGRACMRINAYLFHTCKYSNMHADMHSHTQDPWMVPGFSSIDLAREREASKTDSAFWKWDKVPCVFVCVCLCVLVCVYARALSQAVHVAL